MAPRNLIKALAGILAFCASGAWADAYDTQMRQRNSTNDSWIERVLTVPTDGAHRVMMFYGDILQPIWMQLGSGLSVNSGVLTVSSTQVNADWNAVSGVAQILNKPSIPAAQVNADWASSSGITQILNKPSFALVATTGNYADLSNKPTIPSIPARSFNYTTRSLNTCFQISSTRDALVTYSVDIATSLSLTSGQQGTVYLETFTDSACSTGTQEVTRFVNGQTGTLTIGLALQQNVTGTLTGVIPAGAYVRLRTQNNTGTPAFTARPGQETLL